MACSSITFYLVLLISSAEPSQSNLLVMIKTTKTVQVS